MANDLTFQQLADQLSANAVVVSDGTNPLPAGVMIDVSAVTEDAIANLSDMGVVETFLKLLRGAQSAQNAVNSSATVGNRLNAFPNSTFGAPTADETGAFSATLTASVVARAPLSINDSVGPVI